MPNSSTRTLTFGDYTLELRVNSANRSKVLYSLKRGKKVIGSLEPRQLAILAFLADRNPGDAVSADEIYNAFWSGAHDTGQNVVHHIGKLRRALGDDKSNPRYILTLPEEQGYQFIAEVSKTGDIGFLEGLSKWSIRHYHEMLETVEPGDGPEDIRIVNMAFDSVSELGLENLLLRGLRIRIVLTNPDHAPLLMAATLIRKGSISSEEQKNLIEDNIRQFGRLANSRYPGTLEWRVSDVMPIGFLTHTSKWAILGLPLARTTYHGGSMLEIPGGTPMWNVLQEEWFYRWHNPSEKDMCITLR